MADTINIIYIDYDCCCVAVKMFSVSPNKHNLIYFPNCVYNVLNQRDFSSYLLMICSVPV